MNVSQENSTMMHFYFNRIYMPAYDYTTARSHAYKRQQTSCLAKLAFMPGDKVLCIGAGTGKEVVGMFEVEEDMHITGGDSSRNALNRARRNNAGRAPRLDPVLMDAHNLPFKDASFDKVYCRHVMGFLDDDESATCEAMRVLKEGGQFIITYPTGGGARLLLEVGRYVLFKLRRFEVHLAAAEIAAVFGAGLLNIPIAYWVKPKKGFYDAGLLADMLSRSDVTNFRIEPDLSYQDLLAYGTKEERGMKHAT